MPILRLRGKSKQAPTRQTMHFLSKSPLAFHSPPLPCPEELARIRRDLKPSVYNSSAAWMTWRIRKPAALSTMVNRESHRIDTRQCVLGRGWGGGWSTPRPFNLKGDILSHRWAAGLKICTHNTCDRRLRSQSNGEGKGCASSRRGQLFQVCNSALGGWKGPSWERLPPSSPSRWRNMQRLPSQQPMREQPIDCGSEPPPPEHSLPQF